MMKCKYGDQVKTNFGEGIVISGKRIAIFGSSDNIVKVSDCISIEVIKTSFQRNIDNSKKTISIINSISDKENSL